MDKIIKVGDYIFCNAHDRAYNSLRLLGVVSEVKKSRVYYFELPELIVYLREDEAGYANYRLPLPKEVIGFQVEGGMGQVPHASLVRNYVKDNSVRLSLSSYDEAYLAWRNGCSISQFETEFNRYLTSMNAKTRAANSFVLPDMPRPELVLCDDVSLHATEYQKEIKPFVDFLMGKGCDPDVMQYGKSFWSKQGDIGFPSLTAHINR